MICGDQYDATKNDAYGWRRPLRMVIGLQASAKASDLSFKMPSERLGQRYRVPHRILQLPP
jgi:hypothetical protein